MFKCENCGDQSKPREKQYEFVKTREKEYENIRYKKVGYKNVEEKFYTNGREIDQAFSFCAKCFNKKEKEE